MKKIFDIVFQLDTSRICQESLRVKELEEKLLKITQTFSIKENNENKQVNKLNRYSMFILINNIY